MTQEEYNSKLKKLIQSKLSLSSHTIHGWHYQFARMNRFYQRAKEADNSIDELDFFISFFQCCFHLKDWIIESQKNDGINWSEKIHKMINTNTSLRICRDICNGMKHLRISDPSIDSKFAVFYEHRPFNKMEGVKQNGWSVFIAENNSKTPVRYFMEDLASNCLKSWSLFIRSEPLLHK